MTDVETKQLMDTQAPEGRPDDAAILSSLADLMDSGSLTGPPGQHEYVIQRLRTMAKDLIPMAIHLAQDAKLWDLAQLHDIEITRSVIVGGSPWVATTKAPKHPVTELGLTPREARNKVLETLGLVKFV